MAGKKLRPAGQKRSAAKANDGGRAAAEAGFQREEASLFPVRTEPGESWEASKSFPAHLGFLRRKRIATGAE